MTVFPPIKYLADKVSHKYLSQMWAVTAVIAAPISKGQRKLCPLMLTEIVQLLGTKGKQIQINRDIGDCVNITQTHCPLSRIPLTLIELHH